MWEVDALPPSLAAAIVAAAERAGVGIVVSAVVDGTPIQRHVSPTAAQLLGRPRDVLIGQPALDSVSARERPGVVEHLRRRLAGEPVPASFETTVIHDDGRESTVHCSIALLPIDGEPSMVAFLHDASGRREAEPARDASESRLRTLVEVAPDGIFVTRDGAIVYVNPAGAKILGVANASELTHQSLGQFLAPHELEVGRARLEMAQRDQRLPIRTYEVRGRAGNTVTVEASSLAIEWEGAPAALTFAHDITQRLRMEAQLARADRLSALGALAAGVAHEINNPLAYVSLGFDSLEQLLHALPDEAREDARMLLEDMRGGVQRVVAITRDLRTFARAREDEPLAASDLSKVLATVARLVTHELKHRIALVVELPADLPPVSCGEHRLEQVFVNLVLNAAQSFEACETSSRITIRAESGDGRVTVDVVDNGPGMPPEIRARVFEPFFTTKPTGKGTGLGLAISQSIVTDAGGELSVESELGRGTTFRVALPVAHEEPRAPVVSSPVVRRARILIVDDEPAIARSLGTLLGQSHDVETTTSGGDAVARLLAGAHYDLILCDLMMPDVTGMEVYERLAQDRPGEEKKLVFMTGGAFTETAQRFLGTVSNPRLEKPFAIVELEALIRDLLR